MMQLRFIEIILSHANPLSARTFRSLLLL